MGPSAAGVKIAEKNQEAMSLPVFAVRLDADNPAEQEETAMQYLMMIYLNEAEYAEVEKKDTDRKMLAEYQAFTQAIIGSGNFKGGDRLQPTSSATTVRVRDGKILTTDGPFAETREQLGGYYMIEAKDLNDAIGIAARIPGARIGSIEVRPVWVYN
jgi:hypothetical protein